MKLINGSILDTELNIMAHGVNCQGAMGRGVAKSISSKYPEVLDEYRAYLDLMGAKDARGTSFTVITKSGMRIGNLFTQEFYGDGKQARYIHLVTSMTEFLSFIPSPFKVAIPMIGCSNGGLDWNIVKEILLEMEERYDVEFWVYSL